MLGRSVLGSHILQTLKDISVQLGHAESVSGPARTGYYKVAILLTASLVEAILYDLIDRKCTADPTLLDGIVTFKKAKGVNVLHKLPSSVVPAGKELWICEVDRSKVDRKGSFGDMTKLALEAGIISRRLASKIDRVRAKRNEIHLQLMSSASRRYDRRTVEHAGTVLLELLDLLP